MGTAYQLKIPMAYIAYLIIALISCSIFSYYYWEYVVINPYLLDLHATADYYNMAFVAGIMVIIPMIIWLLSTRVLRQRTIKKRVTKAAENYQLTKFQVVKNALLFKDLRGVKEDPVTVKRIVKSYETEYYYTAIISLIIAFAVLGLTQYYVFRYYGNYSVELAMVILQWSISLSFLNAIIVAGLGILAYATKIKRSDSRFIPARN